jgi:ribonuclease HII
MQMTNPNEYLICGVDEAGRGPLAGRVYAAAVVLDPNNPISGLRDSKKLSATKRELLYQQITDTALAYAISYASVAEIDSLNILNATLLAMERAVTELSLRITPSLVMIDGNKAPKLLLPTQTLVSGDDLIQEISAASILAKVSRDWEMLSLHDDYPEYNFAKHKGYGTKEHIAAIEKYGQIEGLHRKSFHLKKQVELF